MKVWQKVVLAVMLFGGGLWAGSVFVSEADGLLSPGQPGSAEDPLVTKSYVDEQIESLVRKELENQTGSAGGAMLKIVQLQPGQTLMAGSGTEIIVRNGNTVAVSDSASGLADVTAGKDVTNGQEVANNHLLISPADGRGIKPVAGSEGTIFVMVRGQYLVLEP